MSWLPSGGGPDHDTRELEAAAEPRLSPDHYLRALTSAQLRAMIEDPAHFSVGERLDADALLRERAEAPVAAPPARTVGLTFDAPEGRAEPRSRATIDPLPAHVAAAQAAVDAIRLIGLGDAVEPDGRVGNGYAAPYGAQQARHRDLGFSATETWPDATDGFATARESDSLRERIADVTAEAARALTQAAYLEELIEYRLIEAARELGRHAGAAAGAWAADGNTDRDAAAQVIALGDAGDDFDDYLPRRPDLSGEWADEATPRSIAEMLTGRDDAEPELVDAISSAWEAGVDETFEDACLAEIRKAAER
jgi:hypothetical protein